MLVTSQQIQHIRKYTGGGGTDLKFILKEALMNNFFTNKSYKKAKPV